MGDESLTGLLPSKLCFFEIFTIRLLIVESGYGTHGFSYFLGYDCVYVPVFPFPACGFSVPFFLKEEFCLESSEQSLCMFGGVESHAFVVDPAVMNSEEMA